MTDDQHDRHEHQGRHGQHGDRERAGEGTPAGGGRWDPLPQGDYDDGATAFVQLPEGGIDALMAGDSPLAAPGHGYVPPQITASPDAPDTGATGTASWPLPAGGGEWPEPGAGGQHGGRPAGDDGFTYNPGETGQWTFEAPAAPVPGQDVTGQWSIPVAGGDLPDESGEFTTSALIDQWGTAPATLPGGAPAPWATEAPGGPWTPEAAEQRPAEGHGDAAGPGTSGGHPGETPYGAPPGGDGASRNEPGALPDTDGALHPGDGAPGEAGSPHPDDVPQAGGAGHAGEVTYAGDATPAGGVPLAGETARPGGAHPGEAAHRAEHGRSTAPHAPYGVGEPYDSGERRHPGAPLPAGDVPHPGAPHQAGDDVPHPGAPHPAGDASQGAEGPRHPGVPGPAAGDDPRPPGPPYPPQDSPRPGESAYPASAATPGESSYDPTGAAGSASSQAPAAGDAVGADQGAHGPGESTEEPRPADGTTAPGASPGPAAEDPASGATGPDQAPGADEPGAQEPPAGPGGPQTAAPPTPEAPADALHARVADAPGDDTRPGTTAAETQADAPPPPPADEHPLASYVLRVNGSDRPVNDAWIGESLLYVLRERLGLAGAKDGCSQGECGACNVQVDGRLVASCLVPAVTTAGSEVRTVEGLAADGQPSDVQRALARCGAVQCGFCVPGMAMTVHDLLEGNPAPTELETRQALCGNLCRCSGYRGVLEAVKEVVAEREAHRTAAGEGEPDGDAPRIPHQGGPSLFEAPGAMDSHDQDGGQA
ncbi:2Fe-2S iron-sulfur cluster-binding protein [Streptomyces sp. bgisy153]|uniref:2Fe-2S iron-sulfur cluster-binding protein n=1 Tax=Streptomyces sp. bgisy153 TaxID=3413793 RepID=UPI003D72EA64